MLDSGERTKLKLLLKVHFGIEGLEQLVTTVGEDFDSVVRQNANKTDAIMDILAHAERNGWTMALLQAIIEDFDERLHSPSKESEIAKVREIETSLITRLGRGTALQNPFHSCFVRGDHPFINRPTISSALATLAKPAGFRIATINGPPGSGKSYSRKLPQFVSEIQRGQPFKVYYYDLSEGNHSITAQELARKILLGWGLVEPIPLQASQSSSYAVELSEWLVAKVPQDETWWIIVDGLAKLDAPDPSLLHFLTELAHLVADSPHDLRLVLLDWDKSDKRRPLSPSAYEMTTQVQIEEITITDLVEHYFKILHEARQKPFDTNLIEQKAKWILEQSLSQSENKQHAKLKDFLWEVTKELGLVE